MDVATLTELLREAKERHTAYEATAPEHGWTDWYAAYVAARVGGSTPDDAAARAGVHVDALRS